MIGWGRSIRVEDKVREILSREKCVSTWSTQSIAGWGRGTGPPTKTQIGAAKGFGEGREESDFILMSLMWPLH